MATSSYFNNYGSLSEQRVIEDIIVESIKIMGFDAYYLINENDQARDLLFGEDPLKKFTTAFPLEMYLSNSTEYMGEKEFFSKFGLEIRNNVSVILSKRSFAQRVPQDTVTRPREGDLIYIPFLNGTGELYEIKFTNQTKDFFMLGRKVPYFYELEMEKFKYSQEVISTGIAEIDDVATQSAYTIDLKMGVGFGDYQEKEIVFYSPDNTYANATATAIVQSWNFVTETLSVSNIMGEFAKNASVNGTTSGASYILYNYDPLSPSMRNENYDNAFIELQGSLIKDNSEINPFGDI